MSTIKKTAAELAALMASGEVSATEVAQAHLDRIAAVDGAVKAFLHVDADNVLDQARAVELQPPYLVQRDRERRLQGRRRRQTRPDRHLRGKVHVEAGQARQVGAHLAKAPGDTERVRGPSVNGARHGRAQRELGGRGPVA